MWCNAAHDSPTDKVSFVTEDGTEFFTICDERALDIFKNDKDKNRIYYYYIVVNFQTYDILKLSGQTMQQYVDAMFDITIEWKPEGE